MTREDVSRTLRQMEAVREQSYEAESRAEERRLDAEYGRMWDAIEPYVSGKLPYSESRPGAAAQDALAWRARDA